MTSSQNLKIRWPSGGPVSGLLDRPDAAPSACFVFAHGAGAGMKHAFMSGLAAALVERGIAVLRFQFPYMEAGTKRPDPPAVAQAAVRAAVMAARQLLPEVPLFAGGKSFGGRMTSQAHAAKPLPDVKGIVFVGFPLHAPNKPSVERSGHLAQVDVPMLFLQGTRDALADLELIRQVTQPLPKATLHVVEGGDHSFDVPVRSGRTNEEVRAELADTISGWVQRYA